MQIKSQFVVLFVLLAAVIGGVLYVEYHSQRQEAFHDARTDVAQSAELTATLLDTKLRHKQRMLSYASTDPRLERHGTTRQYRTLESFVAQSQFDGASVVAANGTMVAIAGVSAETRRRVVGQDYSNRRYVQRALAGETYISDPLAAETRNTVVVVSAPIRAPNGTVVGTLNGAFHLSHTDFFSSLNSLQQNAQYAVVHVRNRTLFVGNHTFSRSIHETAHLETTGWVVTVHQNRAAVTARLYEFFLVQVLAGAVLFASLAVFGVWVYRTDVAQTRKLLDAFHDIERREYDVDADLSGSEEWVEIGDAITRLSETLNERENMLLVLNRLLRHNLRNSLNVVLGRAALVAERELPPDSREDVEVIRESAEELRVLGEKARRIERLLSPAETDTLAATDVAELVADARDEFAAEYPDATITVTAAETTFVDAGSDLRDALDELLENAVKHAGDAPTVRLAVENAADDVAIVVEDDGDGIPDDERAVITGERRISQLHHSAGLGLWLVEWIVRRYDGELTIETDDGTRVVMRLPKSEADEA